MGHSPSLLASAAECFCGVREPEEKSTSLNAARIAALLGENAFPKKVRRMSSSREEEQDKSRKGFKRLSHRGKVKGVHHKSGTDAIWGGQEQGFAASGGIRLVTSPPEAPVQRNAPEGAGNRLARIRSRTVL